MKICTITYDGDNPVGLPGRPASDARVQILRLTYMQEIRHTVHELAEKHGIDQSSFIWADEAGIHPVFLRVACDEKMEDLLRFKLPDDYIVEFDPAPCNRVLDRVAHLQL